MKILQVVSYYPPALSFGGPPQVMFDLGRELVRRGHQVSVYTTDALNIEDWTARAEKATEDIDGIKVRRFRRLRHVHRLPTKFGRLLVAGVDEQCAREMASFDIVHMGEVTSPLAIGCSSWARRQRVPYAISIFGNLSPANNLPMAALRSAFGFLWGKRLLANAAALLVQTPHEGDICARYTARDRIVPMMLPVDMALFQSLPARGSFRDKFGISRSDEMVLFLGRVSKYKGVALLVSAFARLRDNHAGARRLVIAGADEGYKRSLMAEVQTLGIGDRVTFTGPIFGRDKLAAYTDADVFVTTPTIFEETSLAALEACACSTPAIITERNAIPGLEEYQAGFQIHFNEDELTSTLARLLGDGALRDQMRHNARRLIEDRYALDKVVDRMESVFGGLIGPRL